MTGDECATRRSSASHGARLGRGGPSTATHQEGLVCACSCCYLFVCLLVYVVVAGCAGSGVGSVRGAWVTRQCLRVNLAFNCRGFWICKWDCIHVVVYVCS